MRGRGAVVFAQAFGNENGDDVKQSQGEKEIERVLDCDRVADRAHLVVYGVEQHHAGEHGRNPDA